MIERRKFIRLQAPLGVVYKTIKKNKRQAPVPSLIKNIGGGGVRVIVKEDLRPGDLLELQIQIPHLEEPIHAVGEVVWFSHSKEKENDQREAGLRFREIEPEDLHRILEFVHTIGIG